MDDGRQVTATLGSRVSPSTAEDAFAGDGTR
jgi:hypothetical protein